MSDSPAFDLHGAEQVRSVGTAFLRLRPLLVAPAGGLALIVTVVSGGPRAQVLALAALYAVVIGFFSFEAWRARRVTVTLPGFALSLALTIGFLGLLAWLTGAIDSPLLPVFFAPVVVGLSAFGRSPASLGLVALFGGALVLLVAAAPFRPFPPYPLAAQRALTLGGFGLALLLIATGVVGLVDAHRRAGIELDRARAQALREAAARTRDLETVSAKLAHEIRNPLVAIKGLVQLLARGPSGERDLKRFEVVLSEVDRLETIVGDYLSFARPFESLKLSRAALVPLLNEVARVVEGQAAAQGVRVSVSGEEIAVTGDENRLKQALLNLLTNALEATPPGGKISLSARRRADRAELVVEDSGRGMAADFVGRVGTPFLTTREHGTGLGVAIARGIAEQHGGELCFESEEQRGTRATLSVPLGGPS
jgi:two-component system sensor histidine kinase HydH